MMGEHVVRPCSSPAFCRSVVLLLLFVSMTTAGILKNDPKCLSIGGLCVDSDSCDIESRASNDTALCADQGGVCCYRVPQDEDCRHHGGQCGQEEECRNVRDFGQLDCKEGSKCCLLIL